MEKIFERRHRLPTATFMNMSPITADDGAYSRCIGKLDNTSPGTIGQAVKEKVKARLINPSLSLACGDDIHPLPVKEGGRTFYGRINRRTLR
jgi:hypothetical protein